jgi:hypothetical protein
LAAEFWRYQPLATSSKTMPANMTDEIKNYELFERFFFQEEKTFLQRRAKIENENEMESFLKYNKWYNSMAECKEEFYYKKSDDFFFLWWCRIVSGKILKPPLVKANGF